MMTVAYYQIVRVLWKSDTIPGHRESRNQTYTCGCKWKSTQTMNEFAEIKLKKFGSASTNTAV